MNAPEPLLRLPLRERIIDIVREEVIRGDLPPGAPVRDGELARRLGASRTPVREALIRLSAEGLLENRVGCGFRVAPLTRAEIEEVHPLLTRFEPLALELSSPLDAETAEHLEVLTRELDDPELEPLRRHELDARWHRALISGCPNARLVRYVEELREVLRRYELAYQDGVEDMQQSIAEHREIAARLVAGERERAVALLTEHWQRGRGELLAALPAETSS